MIIYESLKHEMLLLDWHLKLKVEPEEYDKIFADQTHTLTDLLGWASTKVILAFEMDKEGVWAACWVEPCLNAAYFGSWIRKSKRHTKSALKFINEAYARVLDKFPTILGLTSQPNLADLHIKLGYVYGCRIPQMFNGKDALLFVMTRESREARKHGRSGQRRQDLLVNEQHIESVRAVSDADGPAVVSRGQQLSAPISGAGNGSPANGRRKLANPDHKRKPRVRTKSRKFKHERHQGPSVPSGIAE